MLSTKIGQSNGCSSANRVACWIIGVFVTVAVIVMTVRMSSDRYAPERCAPKERFAASTERVYRGGSFVTVFATVQTVPMKKRAADGAAVVREWIENCVFCVTPHFIYK